jgi:hypothetical protein
MTKGIQKNVYKERIQKDRLVGLQQQINKELLHDKYRKRGIHMN